MGNTYMRKSPQAKHKTQTHFLRQLLIVSFAISELRFYSWLLINLFYISL